jgi:dTDP-4-dehydrorhamnose reductase
MTNFLVIGKNGTLGSEFEKLLDKQAICLDSSELDITDELAVHEKINSLMPEVVINCAAYNAVDKAELEPEKAELINGTAVGILADACEKVGATLVHFSTNYVFDGTKEEGYVEADTTNPQSQYGQSKLLGEVEAIKNCSRTYVIRTAWLYGDQGNSKTSKVNYITRILQLAEEKEFLEGVSDQFGQPTWTKDLAKFTLELVDKTKPFGIYHGTNSGSATWYSWATEILKLKGLEKEVRENKMADFHVSGHTAPRPQYGILLNTKTTPMRFWQEALADYLNSK